MWYLLPKLVTILCIFLNLFTCLALLFPPKKPGRGLRTRIRCGIALILACCFTIYAVILQSDIYERDLGCRLASIAVHYLSLSATFWLLTEIINAIYDIMGYEKRISGMDLNKLILTLQSFPFLVLFVSLVVALVDETKYIVSNRPSYVNGTKIEKADKDKDSCCWLNPINYWLTWNLPTVLVGLIVICITYNIANIYKFSRVFSFTDKGPEISWSRETLIIVPLYVCMMVIASLMDLGRTSGTAIPQQATFALFYFLFSIAIIWFWVCCVPHIAEFWCDIKNNVSVSCITCNFCDLEVGVIGKNSVAGSRSSMFVNQQSAAADLDDLSNVSSVCSGGECRHVNKKCAARTPTIVSKPSILNDEGSIGAASDGPEVDFDVIGVDRRRRFSKVSFSDMAVIIDTKTATPELSLQQDAPEVVIHSILRTDSTTSAGSVTVSEERETDSPVYAVPVKVASEGESENDRPNKEVVEKISKVLEEKMSKTTHEGRYSHCLEELLTSYEESEGKVENVKVYTPSPEKNFSQHLKELVSDFEKAATPPRTESPEEIERAESPEEIEKPNTYSPRDVERKSLLEEQDSDDYMTPPDRPPPRIAGQEESPVDFSKAVFGTPSSN